MTETSRIELEQFPNGQTQALQGEATQLDVNALPLIDKDVALSTRGINGNILSVITLPSDSTEFPPKQLALVDFGEFTAKRPYLYDISGVSQKITGHAKSRFGLLAYNYTPLDHMLAYAPVSPGQNTYGRVDTHWNRALGLTHNKRDNGEISRTHFSIRYNDKDNQIEIADHSINGTEVTTALNRQETAKASRVRKLLGRSATKTDK